jgi:glycosyltransferase involved in cell wall biosynthesis
MSGAAASPLQDDVSAAPQPTPVRALVVTFGSVLSPDHGLAVRARATIDALARLGIRSTVISHCEPDRARPPSIEELHVLRRRLRLGWSTELARAVRARQGDADIIVVESALLLPAIWVARPTPPIVWDTTECETLHYARVASSPANRLRGFVWRLIERWSVARAKVVVALGETEAAWWARLFPSSQEKLAVVDHCSPARPVEYDRARVELERLCGVPLRGPIVLFVGNLVAKQNVTAAHWMVEVLAPQLPSDASLVVAGPGTDGLVNPESSSALVCCLGGVSNIDIVIGGADLCVAPLVSGSGVKTKVLHYLGHSKPVVATPVAMEGIEDAPGVTTTALEEFPAAILKWLSRRESPEVGRRRESLQRTWLQERFGPERVTDQWRDALSAAGVTLP